MLTFTQQGIDLTAAVNVYVTFQSGAFKLTKSGEDLVIGEKSIGVKLSQKETSHFSVGNVMIQANWTTGTGDRAASEVVNYTITKQLLAEVIE